MPANSVAWTHWTFEPDIVLPTLAICAIYGSGLWRRRAFTDPRAIWRHVSFVAGLAIVNLALASVLDDLADRLFWAHQIQHLLLRMIGPMLVALAMPQAALIAGLPRFLRGGVLAPFAGNGVLHRIFSTLTNAWVVSALFIGSLCVWQMPGLHNAAIADEGLHYTMHVSMLVAGLLFWWRIFDMRPAPVGLGYGVRLMMLWVAMLAQIGLGAYLTLKSTLLYPAYGSAGRLFGIGPLTDEAIGGFIIWVPSAMMILLAIVVVVHIWGRHEDRVWAATGTSARYPLTGAALIKSTQSKNRRLAIGIAAFAVVVFSSTIAAGLLSRFDAREWSYARTVQRRHVARLPGPAIASHPRAKLTSAP